MLLSRNRALAAAAVLSLAGCASMAVGTNQDVHFDSTPVSDVSCEISNSRGTWKVTTPGDVMVLRSTSLLRVHCSKDGFKDYTGLLAPSQSTIGMVGDALPYVGLAAAAIDASTGDSNQYPPSIIIHLKPPNPPPAVSSTKQAAN